jgi:uncharacterized membrane protein YdjX (TVP38/TMEM64 family)
VRDRISRLHLSRRHLLFGLLLLLFLGRGSILPLLSSIRAGDVEGYLRSYGALSPAVFVGLMVLQAVIVPIPSTPLVMAGGILFGVYKGTLLSWIGATLGALIDFHLGRRLGGPFVERVLSEEDRKEVNRFAEKRGFYAIFLTHLVPGVSIDVISYGAGLTGMPYSTFFWATVLGMVPGTFLYSYLGNRLVAQGAPFQVLLTLLLLGTLLVLPPLLRRLRART